MIKKKILVIVYRKKEDNTEILALKENDADPIEQAEHERSYGHRSNKSLRQANRIKHKNAGVLATDYLLRR
mgnify:CR=1 FL=1